MGERANGLMRGASALKRRGMLAGVVALVGAGLTKLGGPERARAAHDGSADQTVIHADAENTTSATTYILMNNPGWRNPALSVVNNSNVLAASSFDGIQGFCGANGGAAGVRGQATGTSAVTYGVWGGTESAQPSGSGVVGESLAGETNGVWGYTWSSAANATGVFGLARHTTSGNVGVWGRSLSTAASAVGTYGEVSAANAAGTGMRGKSTHGPGVWGTSATAYGVLGQSSSGAGLFGDSTAPGGYGVFGRSTSGAAIFGTTTNGYAASFNGPVVVQGSFTVTGGPKSAAVPHPDGSHRRMFCQESPEPWFEDFGAAQLVNGRAVVDLDPDFDAVVRGDEYLVFPVAEGDCNGLWVSKKGPHRFQVEELKGGKSSLPFSYRVVSRRRDTVGKRLEKVDLRNAAPSIKLPDPIKPGGQTTISVPTRQDAPAPPDGR